MAKYWKKFSKDFKEVKISCSLYHRTFYFTFPGHYTENRETFNQAVAWLKQNPKFLEPYQAGGLEAEDLVTSVYCAARKEAKLSRNQT